MEPQRKPGLLVVEKGPGGREAALCCDDAAWYWSEGAQRGSAHPVDVRLVLLLDPPSSVPGELRCVEYGSLDDSYLEVPCCRRVNSALVDDAA